MGIRYSYSDYTTKGHGVIETGSSHEDYEDHSYGPAKKIPTEYKFVKTVPHIDQISDTIRNMNPSRKTVFLREFKVNGTLKVGKLTYVRWRKGGGADIYRKPVAAKKPSKAKKAENRQTKEDIYKNLKRINDQARSKRRN